ncbi:MAG TPA: phosphoglycerate mutase family protein [Steroidobacteraceae bacterium]|nr:phosphoglycerate mutase family protein [Steroidobacteraceae bacterium]
MEAPAVTRSRRPFLAPLWLTLLGLVVMAGIAWSVYRAAGTTVVLLVPTTAREPGTIADPPLSAEGEEQAQRLARLLGDAAAAGALDAIYVSDEQRAKQTAAPLAERLQRAPVVFAAADAATTAARAVHEHAGRTVLVIGGAGALPQMLEELTGTEVSRAPVQSDLIYVVSVPTFGRAHVLRLKF